MPPFVFPNGNEREIEPNELEESSAHPYFLALNEKQRDTVIKPKILEKEEMPQVSWRHIQSEIVGNRMMQLPFLTKLSPRPLNLMIVSRAAGCVL